MNIAVISMFRNATTYLERYFAQMMAFQLQLSRSDHTLRLVLGYGDSQDGTGAVLFEECAHRFNAHLIDCSHQGPEFGSVVHPTRFKQLAFVANKLWRNLPKDIDYVLVVESDLIWTASTLSSLLNSAEAIRSIDIPQRSHLLLAPQIKGPDGLFYDTWAFRTGGKSFTKFPVHTVVVEPYLEMDSVGSCVLMDYGIAQQLSWPEADLFVGLCRMAREKGATILMDGSLVVNHP